MDRETLRRSKCVPDFFEMLDVMEGAWSEFQYVQDTPDGEYRLRKL